LEQSLEVSAVAFVQILSMGEPTPYLNKVDKYRCGSTSIVKVASQLPFHRRDHVLL
jgi:hypothetical protein